MREIVPIVRWVSYCLMEKDSEDQRAHLHLLMHLAELAILRPHLGNSQLSTIVSKGQTRHNPESWTAKIKKVQMVESNPKNKAQFQLTCRHFSAKRPQ